jgi:hypothetical protein
MTEDHIRKHYQGMHLPRWHYLGGSSVIGSDTGVEVTLPSECTCLVFGTENGVCYYDLNNVTASPNSPGFIPQDAVVPIGAIGNLSRLDVYGATGTTIHIMFFKEA